MDQNIVKQQYPHPAAGKTKVLLRTSYSMSLVNRLALKYGETATPSHTQDPGQVVLQSRSDSAYDQVLLLGPGASATHIR
jgi:hypothetical protein